MRRSHGSQRPAKAPDMTPMIDIVFLMLIFFVCTMKFRVIEGRLDTELPQDTGPASAEVVDLLDPLELHLVADPSRPRGLGVRVQRGPTRSVDALPALVRRWVDAASQPRARVSTEADVTYDHVVAVVDACLAGGLPDITFAGH